MDNPKNSYQRDTLKADKVYSQRAASRLKRILDELGYPDDLMGRAVALARKLEIKEQHAIELLSGITIWSFEDLQLVGGAFERDPGFFLDKHYASRFPTDSHVVASLDGVETIVWRSPQGFLKHELLMSSDVVLRSLRVSSEVVKVFEPGELLICASHPSAPKTLENGSCYIIEAREQHEVMRCIDIQQEFARFEPLTDRIGAISVRYPNDYAGDEKRARVIACVIAAIRAV